MTMTNIHWRRDLFVMLSTVLYLEWCIVGVPVMLVRSEGNLLWAIGWVPLLQLMLYACLITLVDRARHPVMQ